MLLGHQSIGIVGALLKDGASIEHSGVVVGAVDGLAANRDAGRSIRFKF